jgi:signal transduction histidine kinase
MRRRASLRGRVMMGAVLWTLGLMAVITIVLTFSPRARQTVLIVHSHNLIAAAFAVGSMVAGLALVRGALAPFDELRLRLSEMRQGRQRQLQGSYPSEVQPLVDDLNALLDHRERAVSRALAKAGDLAHGLKTPLAVLAQEAARAETHGYAEMASTIGQQVERMRRQMNYHLAQARAAASGATPGARCAVTASAVGLARTLGRLYANRSLTVDVSVPVDHYVRGQREDLDEMLGNILDNACKWAASRVQISSSLDGGAVEILVDDDGPGLAPSMRDAVLQRGVRADEAAPGTGLGLAIVRDLADVYGGSITLAHSPLGGVRAQLRLPAS